MGFPLLQHYTERKLYIAYLERPHKFCEFILHVFSFRIWWKFLGRRVIRDYI